MRSATNYLKLQNFSFIVYSTLSINTLSKWLSSIFYILLQQEHDYLNTLVVTARGDKGSITGSGGLLRWHQTELQ